MFICSMGHRLAWMFKHGVYLDNHTTCTDTLRRRIMNNHVRSNYSLLLILLVKYTTDYPNSASYLDLYPEHDNNLTLTTKLYDKHDDFNFSVVNYPFLDSYIPSCPAYGVYMSQLIRYSKTCNTYQDFLHRDVLLTRKLLSQGFIETTLRSTLKKFFGRYHHFIPPYRVAVTTVGNDICRQWYCCHKYVSCLDTT